MITTGYAIPFRPWRRQINTVLDVACVVYVVRLLVGAYPSVSNAVFKTNEHGTLEFHGTKSESAFVLYNSTAWDPGSSAQSYIKLLLR